MWDFFLFLFFFRCHFFKISSRTYIFSMYHSRDSGPIMTTWKRDTSSITAHLRPSFLFPTMKRENQSSFSSWLILMNRSRDGIHYSLALPATRIRHSTRETYADVYILCGTYAILSMEILTFEGNINNDSALVRESLQF